MCCTRRCGESPGSIWRAARRVTRWNRRPWPMRLISNSFELAAFAARIARTFWRSARKSSVEFWWTMRAAVGMPSVGGNAVRVPLDDVLEGARTRGIEMLALDDALESLSKVDGRKGRVVELRYFGGLSIEETAEVVGVSPETVKRDWKMAKAWLFAALTGEQDHHLP
jgi:RNA polymerase sigma factor (sigma-70 family)